MDNLDRLWGNPDFSIIQQGLSVIILLTVIANLLMAVYWINQNRSQANYLKPALFWLVHLMLFYLVVNIRNFSQGATPTQTLTLWSTLVRWHGQTTVGALLIFHIQRKVQRPAAMQEAVSRCKETIEHIRDELLTVTDG